MKMAQDSVCILKLPIFEHYLSVGNLKPRLEWFFEPKLKPKLLLFNWVPVPPTKEKRREEEAKVQEGLQVRLALQTVSYDDHIEADEADENYFEAVHYYHL